MYFPDTCSRFEIEIEGDLSLFETQHPHFCHLSIVIQTAWQLANPFQIFFCFAFQVLAENTYILTLDGDIDFQPPAVSLLVDLMKKNKNLGAACGRIHPVMA